MPLTVAAVIPAHPPRLTNGLLARAVASVAAQTYPVAQLSVAVDLERRGAWHTRQRALDAVDDRIDYVAFLDSDDQWKPEHVAVHVEWAERTGADYVYAWFQLVPDTWEDPFPAWFFSDPWDDNKPRHTTMTVMVRTSLAKQIRFIPPGPQDVRHANEDWRFTLGCVEAGAKIVHIPAARTWLWHRDAPDGVTSGLPTKW